MLAVSGTTGSSAGADALDPRLKPAAREFEASLLKELLEPLQHDSLSEDGTDPASPDGSGNALMSFGTEALARAISDRGGFGIADKILAHFAQQEKRAERSGNGA